MDRQTSEQRGPIALFWLGSIAGLVGLLFAVAAMVSSKPASGNEKLAERMAAVNRDMEELSEGLEEAKERFREQHCGTLRIAERALVELVELQGEYLDPSNAAGAAAEVRAAREEAEAELERVRDLLARFECNEG